MSNYPFDGDARNIRARYEQFWRTSQNATQVFQTQANYDMRFEAGDQGLWNDYYSGINVNVNKQFYFNHIRRIINMISGHQRKNRKSVVVVPVENADEQTADQLTKILMWVNKQEGVLETISDSFHSSLITGMSLLQIWIDYRNDPINGNIKVDRCDYNQFIIDPYFKKKDLSDCSGIIKRSFLSKQDCISLLPEQTDRILAITPSQSSYPIDEKFPYMPQNFNINFNNLMAYDEFYYRDYRDQLLLVDTETGETQEWKSKDMDALESFLLDYPSIIKMETTIPTVKLAIFVQGQLMYDGPQPLGIDDFCFVPVICYYRPEMPQLEKRLTGVVNGLRDPQFLFNRRMVSEFDLLEATATGMKYKESSLIDPSSVFMVGNGRGIALKREANMDDVQPLPVPQVPPSWFEATKSLERNIMTISGANEELMGSADDSKAGILSMLRQGSGLTTFQDVFDNLDYAQKILYNRIVDSIQVNWTTGKIKKVLEGEEPTNQFHNRSFGRYHSAIEDGLNTTTQRQMQFAQMLHLREVGVPIPTESLLDAATLQNKNKIIEQINQQEQEAKQMQSMQAQIQIEKTQSDIKDAEARRLANLGLYNERTSRVTENRALAIERLHQANKDDQAAVLDQAKAFKELESTDIEHLERLSALSNSLKQQQSMQAEQGLERLTEVPVGAEQPMDQTMQQEQSLGVGNQQFDQQPQMNMGNEQMNMGQF